MDTRHISYIIYLPLVLRHPKVLSPVSRLRSCGSCWMLELWVKPEITTAARSVAESKGCRAAGPQGQTLFGWWWLEHEFYFPIYWEVHHPNWLSYFSEGKTEPGFGLDMCFFPTLDRISQLVDLVGIFEYLLQLPNDSCRAYVEVLVDQESPATRRSTPCRPRPWCFALALAMWQVCKLMPQRIPRSDTDFVGSTQLQDIRGYTVYRYVSVCFSEVLWWNAMIWEIWTRKQIESFNLPLWF